MWQLPTKIERGGERERLVAGEGRGGSEVGTEQSVPLRLLAARNSLQLGRASGGGPQSRCKVGSVLLLFTKSNTRLES
jgi:hypothetical protein